jgi:MYXO-CTERM domain-containing protein
MGLAAAMLLSCAPAHAALIGAIVVDETASNGGGPPPPGQPRTIWHVYAVFSQPTFRVNAWGGGGDLGEGVIENILIDGSPGSGFTNVEDAGGGSGQIAPYAPGSVRDWDSYMTIGVRYGNEAPGGIDATFVIPSTPPFIDDGKTQWIAPWYGAGAFITPDDAQGSAAYRVQDSDTVFTVLLMQLVVNQGEHVRGTIGVSWEHETLGGIGGVAPHGVTFTSVPGPGTGAAALLAFLAGARRRRKR